MREALKEIQTGEYAKSSSSRTGPERTTLNCRRRIGASIRSRRSGARLRDMMPWIKKNQLVDQSKN